RQADGSAWEDATSFPGSPADRTKQTFYPDASRIYEEIDRLGVGGDGRSVELSTVADFDFVRACPPGGWKKGRAAEARTDVGEGDIAPEALGVDFHGYYPLHLHREPTLASLARATTIVQRTLDSGEYTGAQWLEGSPTTEESMYWLGLLIDTTLPLVGHSAQRPHGSLSADGDRNIVDGVKYILSGVSLDRTGVDQVGSVMIVDEMVYAAREVTKTDARPGGYDVVGGHGGVVADMGGYGSPQLTFVSTRKHTSTSELRLTKLPDYVMGVTGKPGAPRPVEVQLKDAEGGLLASAMPHVSFTKFFRYLTVGVDAGEADASSEVEILARIRENLAGAPLSGFVAEGMSPYGLTHPTSNAALKLAAFSGMPVVRVGRGNTGGMAYDWDPFAVAGNNLSATKARILLMAAMLKFGALPPAQDPANPTPAEEAALTTALTAYQEVFNTH
ncbi:MAG: L-asparaginase, partial [Frankiales bacterium]|nr:L-asparaginase [Frankiales bacterium]